MKKFALITLTAIAVLTGCNAVAGAGKDISAAGENISNAAEKVKKY